MAKDFSEQFPRWPRDTDKPLLLVDVRVKLPVDKLFGLLYIPGSEFVARSQEVRGNKDYEESPWEGTTEELERFLQSSQAERAGREQQAVELADYKCMLDCNVELKNVDSQFKTEEVQRCTEAQPGKAYEVEVCVATTATYGDKFRGICRHRLTADGASWSRWHAEFALVYITPVNGLLKRAIEKGCAGGLAKNFATLVEVLGGFAEVKQADEERAASAEAPAVPEKDDRIRAPADVKLLGVLDTAFVHMFEPIAARLVPASATLPGRTGGNSTEPSRTALLLAALALLLAVQLTLDVVRVALSATGVNAGLFQPPSSILGVLSSAAVLLLAQAVARRSVLLASWLWLSPERMRRASGSLPSQQDPDIPTNGVRYDGYNAALASASADIASAEASLRQGPAAAAASALQAGSSSADSAARRQQLRMGVRGLQRLVADTWTAGRRAMANGALSPERAVSPPRSEGLGSARGSSPVPASPLSDDEEGGVMSDDALQRPRGSKRLRRNRRSDNVLMKSFNKAANGGRPGSGDDSPEDHSRSVELSMMGQRPFSSTSQGSSQQQMIVETGPVEAEVFENERYLPFRGWGHEWPGHFLPTDRVGHWSLRGDRPSGAESMEFTHVAPSLPEGWEWLEEDWHIDMGGHEDACVDDEGWCYAVDFNWFRHPPLPGSGRFRRVRDYVRRRRWVRTRVRTDDDPATTASLRRLVSMSAPPPLLPLAQLLGEAADLGGQDLVRAISSGGGRAAPPAFELRPGASTRSSGDVITPRLLLGATSAAHARVSLRLRVTEAAAGALGAGAVSVSLLVREAEPLPAPVASPAFSVSATDAAEKATAAPAPLPVPAVTPQHTDDHAQRNPSQEAAAAGTAQGSSSSRQPAQEPAGLQQEQQGLLAVALHDTPEGPSAPRSSFAEPAQASLEDAAGEVSGSKPLAGSVQAEAHIAASLEATFSQQQGGLELAKALSTPLPPEQDDSAGAAEAAPSGAEPVQEAAPPAEAAREDVEQEQPGAPGEQARSTLHAAEHPVQEAANQEHAPEQAEDGVSEDNSWTSVSHPADAAAAVQPPVPEPAPTVGSMTDLVGLPAGSAQEQPPAVDLPEGAAEASVTATAAADKHPSKPEAAAAPASPAAPAVATSQEAAGTDEGQQQLTLQSAPVAPTIARRLSGPLPALPLPRTGSGASLAPTASREDPLHLGDLAKRSTRLAAMAGDQIMKGIAHAARQTGKRDGAAASERAAEDEQPPVAAASRRPSLLLTQEGSGGGGGSSFLQNLKTRGEQSLAAARHALSPDREGGGEAGAATSGSGSPDHAGGLGPSVRGMFSDLRRKTLDRVGHGSPLGGFGKLDSGAHRGGQDSGLHEAADAPQASSEAEAASSMPEQAQHDRPEVAPPARDIKAAKHAEDVSMQKRKTE